MLPTPLLRPSFSTLIRHVHPEFPDRPYSGDGPADPELEVHEYKSPYAGLVVESHVDPRCVIYNAGQKLFRWPPDKLNSLAVVICNTLGISILESQTYLANLQTIYTQWTTVIPRWDRIDQSSYAPSGGSNRTSVKRKADALDDDQRLDDVSEHMEGGDADASDRESNEEEEEEEERVEDPSDGGAIEWNYDRAARCKDTPDLYHGSDGASAASSNSCFDFDAHRDPRVVLSQPFDVARWVAKTGKEVQWGEDVGIGCETHQDEWRSGGGSGGGSKKPAIETAHDTAMV
ncbi:hypothetical protein FIBSPDRAFT_865318 [Athelia psychrophila]|uniref:Uncharacterized protein n=1 Tax=Athelia psychrophila TaxID=1759441 RepID=A0A166FMM7_9AGAM|nr:hypothetical protein FIBSPDRAFT_865318 [Fibularhizoctonia sp. CBS 109695]